MKVFILNLIILASAAAVAYGLWLYSHSLALIVVGLVVMAVAFVTGVSLGKSGTRNLRGSS